MLSVSSPSALYILVITVEETLQQMNHNLKQWLRLIPSDRSIVVAGILKSESSPGQSLFCDLVKSAISEFPNIKQEVPLSFSFFSFAERTHRNIMTGIDQPKRRRGHMVVETVHREACLLCGGRTQGYSDSTKLLSTRGEGAFPTSSV